MNVLFCTTEIQPFSSLGTLAEFSKMLPVYMRKSGIDITVVTPLYKDVDRTKNGLQPYTDYPEAKIALKNLHHDVRFFSAFIPDTDIPVLFVDCPEFFGRDGMYTNPSTNEDFADNAERFAMFMEAVLHLIVMEKVQPDIIHVNDHLTALIPAMLKARTDVTPAFAKIKTVLSMHNVSYQQDADESLADHMGLRDSLFQPTGPYESDGRLNFLKAGVLAADKVVTVSQTYAKDIVETPELGHGLGTILKDRGEDFFGILNGVDYSDWTPKKDPLIEAPFSVSNLTGKEKNKRELLALNGLDYSKMNMPTIGMITNLTDDKGFDLLIPVIEKIMTFDVNMVLLGSGEARYHRLFENIKLRFPHKLGLNLIRSERIEHMILAGSDFFLMPSQYEPCGHHQMLAMKYGAVPIVRATGGLADTVMDVDEKSEDGWGFTFTEYDSTELLKTVWRAVSWYKKKTAFRKLVQRAMRRDFSWKSSADAYLDVYRSLVE